MSFQPNRRQALAAAAAVALPVGAAEPEFRVAPFTAEITPPLGHPLMGGGVAPAKTIEEPLLANGFTLLGAGEPIVFVSLDWCEVRNDAYDRWRTVLAEAVGTAPKRVLVTAIHQHDTPIADLTAQIILNDHKATGAICDLEFHEKAVQRVAAAAREAARSPQRVTTLGIGQAKVERVASNRRTLNPDGTPHYSRMSATRDAALRDRPEGTIDPYLKTLTLWDGERAVVGLSVYSVHPMSYYGKGGVTPDFPGLARKRRQVDGPKTLQIYASGCSGNTVAGKYNDGNPANRDILADSLYKGMAAAWAATKQHTLKAIGFRSVELRLEPRTDPGFTEADLTKRLSAERPFQQCLGALGLSWLRRCRKGQPIDVPVIDFGPAQLILLPAESYVEYQLMAQAARPDSFVLTCGYGECGPGYIPIERAWAEKDSNLGEWCWVSRGSEPRMKAAIEAALKG